jgi:hypothetical protein
MGQAEVPPTDYRREDDGGDSLDGFDPVDHAGRPSTARYPIRKVTTPVPVEGGVEGGALTMSTGTVKP